MKTFTDNAGRSWTITINVEAIKRVRSLINVDLLEAVEGKLLERLVADPVLLCDTLYALCKPQADQQNIPDEEFGRSMAGDAIELATAALLEELVDFFPKDRRRLLGKALAKLRKLEQMAIGAAEERIDSDTLEKQMEAALAELQSELQMDRQARGGSSGSSPASSASTPAR